MGVCINYRGLGQIYLVVTRERVFGECGGRKVQRPTHLLDVSTGALGTWDAVNHSLLAISQDRVLWVHKLLS